MTLTINCYGYIKMLYKNEWYPIFDGSKSCLVVDSQGHKLLPWTVTFTGSKPFFPEFLIYTLDFCYLETETKLTNGCKRISSSSRYYRYQRRPPTRHGRLGRPSPYRPCCMVTAKCILIRPWTSLSRIYLRLWSTFEYRTCVICSEI